MAQYLILIYENERGRGQATAGRPPGRDGRPRPVPAQVVELGGDLVGGNALQPTTTATTIRGDVVTDGPFVETKEALGGYYLIEAADLDQALAIAQALPGPVRRRRGPADHDLRVADLRRP